MLLINKDSSQARFGIMFRQERVGKHLFYLCFFIIFLINIMFCQERVGKYVWDKVLTKNLIKAPTWKAPTKGAVKVFFTLESAEEDMMVAVVA